MTFISEWRHSSFKEPRISYSSCNFLHFKQFLLNNRKKVCKKYRQFLRLSQALLYQTQTEVLRGMNLSGVCLSPTRKCN